MVTRTAISPRGSRSEGMTSSRAGLVAQGCGAAQWSVPRWTGPQSCSCCPRVIGASPAMVERCSSTMRTAGAPREVREQPSAAARNPSGRKAAASIRSARSRWVSLIRFITKVSVYDHTVGGPQCNQSEGSMKMSSGSQPWAAFPVLPVSEEDAIWIASTVPGASRPRRSDRDARARSHDASRPGSHEVTRRITEVRRAQWIPQWRWER